MSDNVAISTSCFNNWNKFRKQIFFCRFRNGKCVKRLHFFRVNLKSTLFGCAVIRVQYQNTYLAMTYQLNHCFEITGVINIAKPHCCNLDIAWTQMCPVLICYSTYKANKYVDISLFRYISNSSVNSCTFFFVFLKKGAIVLPKSPVRQICDVQACWLNSGSYRCRFTCMWQKFYTLLKEGRHGRTKAPLGPNH